MTDLNVRKYSKWTQTSDNMIFYLNTVSEMEFLLHQKKTI